MASAAVRTGDSSLDPATVTLALVSKVARAAALQIDKINAVGARLADVLEHGHRVYVFGAGHAQMFGMELCFRAGGLVGFISMSLQDLRTKVRPAYLELMDSKPERIPENGPKLLDLYRVTPDDAVLVASHSGRNGASVEMALECQRRSIFVVGVTSLISAFVPSRHPSGRKLFEAVDMVLDNGCDFGDALVTIDSGEKIAAASSIAFVALAQAINTAVAAELMRRGVKPPVIMSANLDEGDDHNRALGLGASGLHVLDDKE